MPKNCKDCKYKLKYEYYCKESELKEQIEIGEILTEIRNCSINYNDAPSPEMVSYNKALKEKMEPQNSTYRVLLKWISIIAIIGYMNDSK